MATTGPNLPPGETVDRAVDVFERAKATAAGPTLRGATIDKLLERGCADDPADAEAALYALSFASIPSRRLGDVCGRLLDLAEDPSLPATIRAQAIEGVANHLGGTKRAALRRAAATQLPRLAGDPAAEVRFWCAFALGTIGGRGVKHVLRRLLGDDNVVPGWWTVGQEASDALDRLEGRERPERTPTQSDRAR